MHQDMNRRQFIAGGAAVLGIGALPTILRAAPGEWFAVVYGEKSKIIRRKIFTDGNPDQSALDCAAQNLVMGEAIVFFRAADHAPDKRRVEHLQPFIGEPAHSGRCCQVDAEGYVFGVVMADPDIDDHRPYRLVQHDEAGIGWFLGISS
jgi:hypothetical protein